MNNIAFDTFAPVFRVASTQWIINRRPRSMSHMQLIRQVEKPDYHAYEIAVPGMTRHDVAVEIQWQELCVSARRPVDGMRHVGNEYSQNFSLPPKADKSGITAQCRNGLLTIRVPLPKNPSRRIQVQHANNPENDNWWQKAYNKITSLRSRLKAAIIKKPG